MKRHCRDVIEQNRENAGRSGAVVREGTVEFGEAMGRRGVRFAQQDKGELRAIELIADFGGPVIAGLDLPVLPNGEQAAGYQWLQCINKGPFQMLVSMSIGNKGGQRHSSKSYCC